MATPDFRKAAASTQCSPSDPLRVLFRQVVAGASSRRPGGLEWRTPTSHEAMTATSTQSLSGSLPLWLLLRQDP